MAARRRYLICFAITAAGILAACGLAAVCYHTAVLPNIRVLTREEWFAWLDYRDKPDDPPLLVSVLLGVVGPVALSFLVVCLWSWRTAFALRTAEFVCSGVLAGAVVFCGRLVQAHQAFVSRAWDFLPCACIAVWILYLSLRMSWKRR